MQSQINRNNPILFCEHQIKFLISSDINLITTVTPASSDTKLFQIKMYVHSVIPPPSQPTSKTKQNCRKIFTPNLKFRYNKIIFIIMLIKSF